MSKPYQPTGSTYRFTILKDSNVEYYIGTEKGIKVYKPDRIIKQEPIDEHLQNRNNLQQHPSEAPVRNWKAKEVGITER